MRMCQVAGEVADGLRPHPVCTPSYIEQVMLPAVRAGAQKAGRSLEDFLVCMKPLIAAAATEAELVPKIRDARARIAFYASTPQYLEAVSKPQKCREKCDFHGCKRAVADEIHGALRWRACHASPIAPMSPMPNGIGSSG